MVRYQDRRADMRSDYLNSGLTVRQIAAKYKTCIRTVYNALNGKTNRKNNHKPSRKALYLSKEETETLLFCIMESETTIPNDKKILLPSIEIRLLNIADDMS